MNLPTGIPQGISEFGSKFPPFRAALTLSLLRFGENRVLKPPLLTMPPTILSGPTDSMGCGTLIKWQAIPSLILRRMASMPFPSMELAISSGQIGHGIMLDGTDDYVNLGREAGTRAAQSVLFG